MDILGPEPEDKAQPRTNPHVVQGAACDYGSEGPSSAVRDTHEARSVTIPCRNDGCPSRQSISFRLRR